VLVDELSGPRGISNGWIKFALRTSQGIVRAEVYSNDNRQHVHSLWFYPLNDKAEGSIHLTDLVARLGAPEGVELQTEDSSTLRFSYASRQIEALVSTWVIADRQSPCTRFGARTGVYLGVYSDQAPAEPWKGFNREFDAWCGLSSTTGVG
jgi:hypothetical protein